MSIINALKSERVRLRLHAAGSLTALYLAGKGVISNDDAIFVGTLAAILLAVDQGATAHVKRKQS